MIPRLLLRSFAALTLVVASVPARAVLDLSQTVVERLENGLTVLVLEERSMPLVSVQMLYRVGARNEVVGRTGLAHFLEHMAFRATENFPYTDVVSRIYAAGGEWHGYTWIDQTTYYETVPIEDLDLVLDIEADRMARLELPKEDVEAERGAVLAELHGYENDPGTVLIDYVLAASFQQHPYRYNTIGWESDVERLTYEDVVSFYREHYRPANGVLAVVGAVEPEQVLEMVRERFAALSADPPSPLPRTIEPPQRGVRRVDLQRPGAEDRFLIAWRAPSASDPDWPGFLLLREILGGTEGVSFHQEGFGVPVREGSRLAGVAGSVETWSLASALPYVFGVLGTPAETQSRGGVETAVTEAIEAVREHGVTTKELTEARERLLEELVFDLQTTEDAAHQLAYYEGIDALGVLLDLPARLRAVTAEDVRRVAREWLRPEGRTVGWAGAGEVEKEERRKKKEEEEGDLQAPVVEAGDLQAGRVLGPAGQSSTAGTEGGSVGPCPPAFQPFSPSALQPQSDRNSAFCLSSGLPVVFHRSTLSPTGYLRIVRPGEVEAEGDLSVDDPVWRHTSLGTRFLAGDLEEAAAEAFGRWREAKVSAADPDPPGSPGARLSWELRKGLGIEEAVSGGAAPALLVVSGDLERKKVLEVLEEQFGSVRPVALPASPSPAVAPLVPVPPLPGLVQAQLGYAVPAPPPTADDWAAWRMLLYVLTHDYEGRLGKEAISRRGLLYWIGSDYQCDGRSAWISIEMGVDPPKLEPLRALLEETLAGLKSSPPTDREIAEARSHLLGRHRTAAQSNPEITARLAEEAICFGETLNREELARRLEATTREDVLAVLDEFLAGVIVSVR